MGRGDTKLTMAPTPNKESAKGACNDTSEAMPFLQPSEQEKLDLCNLPLTKSSCWVEHKKEGYVRGEVKETVDGKCHIESEKGDVRNCYFLSQHNTKGGINSFLPL